MPVTQPIGDVRANLVWSPQGDEALVIPAAQDEWHLFSIRNQSLGACVTCRSHDSGSPSYSPDGEWIAFSDESGLVLTTSDARTRRRLAELSSWVMWIDWPPDASSVAFTGVVGLESDIYRVGIADGRVINLTGGWEGDFYSPAWSPDGLRIAYHAFVEGGLRVETMSADASGRHEVARWSFGGEIFDPGIWPPQWSPDGERLLFTSDSPLGDADVFVVNADGSGLRNLTNSPGHDTDPVWSPDGQKIAFVSTRDGDYEIYVMNADGSHQVDVSNSPETMDVSPQWRPRPSVSPLAYAAGGLVAALLIGLIVAGVLRRMRARGP